MARACADLAGAPELLAIGDLHVENFGTWRDAEGRFVWGINAFDEAYPMPYTIDLVRLVTSALLEGRAENLSITGRDAAAAILTGYAEIIAAGGKPFILEEEHPHAGTLSRSIRVQCGASRRSSQPCLKAWRRA